MQPVSTCWRGPASDFTFQMLPEVVDELLECVCPLRQRYNDVDEAAARVQTLALHLHHGPEWPEEHELSEVSRAVAFKHQLVNGASVPLGTSQPWDRGREKAGKSHPTFMFSYPLVKHAT